MNIIWLGHSSFRLEIGETVILLDPWLDGNPSFPEDRKSEALDGATHILLTHGHFDHASEVVDIAKAHKLPVIGQFDLMQHWEQNEGLEVTGFNKGGTVDVNGIEITMVHATHSSTMPGPHGPVSTGSEAGYMIKAEGHVIYVSGDTDVMADMAIFEALHKPDIGILCAGGHFTMDMKRAAYAAKTYFNFKTVIPCHYKTFPLLEQSADTLKSELPSANVIEPEVLSAIEI